MVEQVTIVFSTEQASIPKKTLGYRFVKRAFDIVFNALAVVIGFIPGVILSTIITSAIDAKGAPIYNSTRVGHKGPFKFYKFRSMVIDGDNLEKHFTADQLRQQHLEHKVEEGSRVTQFDRFMRACSIDGFAQVINVFLGQIPSRILKMRPELSAKSMGAFALPAKSSMNKNKAFSQVETAIAVNLRTRRVASANSNLTRSAKPAIFAKPIFGAVAT